MGQYNTPDDTDMAKIIRDMQADIERLKRQTRASATSVDSGNFVVRGGGDIIVEDGGRLIVDAAVMVPVYTATKQEIFGSHTLPGAMADVELGSAVVACPSWADTAVLLVVADVYANVGRSTPAFDSGVAVVRGRITLPALSYLGTYAAGTTVINGGSAGNYSITQQFNYSDVIYLDGPLGDLYPTGIEVVLSAYRTTGTSGDASGSLKVVAIFSRQTV